MIFLSTRIRAGVLLSCAMIHSFGYCEDAQPVQAHKERLKLIHNAHQANNLSSAVRAALPPAVLLVRAGTRKNAVQEVVDAYKANDQHAKLSQVEPLTDLIVLGTRSALDTEQNARLTSSDKDVLETIRAIQGIAGNVDRCDRIAKRGRTSTYTAYPILNGYDTSTLIRDLSCNACGRFFVNNNHPNAYDLACKPKTK